ncbi:MAG: hypothetical protein ABIQ47_12260, partial [Tepidiformaceae bacterium]
GDNDSGTTATAEIYNPVTNTWTLTPNVHRARFFSIGDGAFTLADGTVLIATSDNLGDGVATSEVYDPISNSWSTPVAMNSFHCSAATTRLRDGRPLVISGNTCTSPTGNLTAEYYGATPLDTTPPTITAAAKKADNTAYVTGTWTNQTVTVHFTCEDSQSGMATCPADAVYSADGTYTASGTAADNAGNSASASFGPVKIDNTGATITLHLVSHTGGGLAGGTASAYYSGSWHAIAGATDTNGILAAPGVPKGSGLSIAVVYNGTRQQFNMSQLTAGNFTFQTVGVTAQLQDHTTAALDTGSASYYAGSWRIIGNTTSGQAPLVEMLPGSYSFAMVYNGTRQQLDGQNIAANPTVTFQTKLVTVALQDHLGMPLDTGSASYYAGSWRTIGTTTGGQIQVEMLPGSYSFAMVYLGTRQQLDGQNIGVNSTVTFKTGQVHSSSGTATSYYAGSWRPFTQDMELLAGTLTFGFSGGHSNVSQVITGGVLNTIY